MTCACSPDTVPARIAACTDPPPLLERLGQPLVPAGGGPVHPVVVVDPGGRHPWHRRRPPRRPRSRGPAARAPSSCASTRAWATSAARFCAVLMNAGSTSATSFSADSSTSRQRSTGCDSGGTKDCTLMTALKVQRYRLRWLCLRTSVWRSASTRCPGRDVARRSLRLRPASVGKERYRYSNTCSYRSTSLWFSPVELATRSARDHERAPPPVALHERRRPRRAARAASPASWGGTSSSGRAAPSRLARPPS